MKTNVGVWIDHRKAVIGFASEEELVSVIFSHAEKQPGRVDGERSTAPYESLQVPADDVRDRKFEQHLNTYYDEVIVFIQDAKSLLIFGPGVAKVEFRSRLEKLQPKMHVVAVETADKMTDRQVAAKVRDFFRTHNPVGIA